MASRYVIYISQMKLRWQPQMHFEILRATMFKQRLVCCAL